MFDNLIKLFIYESFMLFLLFLVDLMIDVEEYNDNYVDDK